MRRLTLNFRQSQPILLMIGLQAFCLAVGFWFQYQLTVSTTELGASDSACSVLALRSHTIVSEAAQWRVDLLTNGSPELTRAQALLDSAVEADQPRLLLADAAGTILCLSANASSPDWSVGDQVAWHCDRDPGLTGQPKYGRLETPDGERIAIAFPPNAGGVQVIAYSTAPGIPAWAAPLLAALPQASGIAFVWTLILSAVATYLLSARFNFKETHRREQRDHEALRSAQDLLRTRDAVIFGLAKLAESRDPETGEHLERISLYTTRLATALRPYPKYQRSVTPTFIRLLGISSVLHDIGKVGLQDTVLLKPGRLTAEERKQMQQHTLVAGDCLKEIEQRLGASNFLQTAREIALYHHERWDGAGYPSGLTGEAIPLAARIVSIADVYDAMRSKRVYKDAFPHEDCVRAIRAGAGTQFDPELVEVFLEIEAEFDAIARRLANVSTTNDGHGGLMRNLGSSHPERMTSDQEATLRDIVAVQDSSMERTRAGMSLACTGNSFP